MPRCTVVPERERTGRPLETVSMFRFYDVVVGFEERFGLGVAPAFDTDREARVHVNRFLATDWVRNHQRMG